ncbi:metal-dependent hydrolase [Shewanella algae]|uniref:metal-dependent hydrolase n=1 Tax=Shewanella algae TaxID=38313 RepID=UPI003D07060E
MIFRNHLIVTGAVTLVVVKSLELGLPLWAVIGGIFFGSLLPDLDHPSSTIGKRVLFVSVPLAGLFGHRQFTHSILRDPHIFSPELCRTYRFEASYG